MNTPIVRIVKGFIVFMFIYILSYFHVSYIWFWVIVTVFVFIVFVLPYEKIATAFYRRNKK